MRTGLSHPAPPLKSMDSVQGELHKWGNANQVGFDATKESKHVLSLKDPLGPEFKLLGVTFDCKLEMESAVRSLTGKVKWKLLMLLRSRRSFHTTDLVIQYKQQVLSFIEYRTPAIYHATRTVLGRLDKQRFPFRELGIIREASLLDFNLAPLSTRRDIALLGLLHRAAIGRAAAFSRILQATCWQLEASGPACWSEDVSTPTTIHLGARPRV